ncbi:oligosaccharide flippase family protein [Halosimplex amylolyticum]|uniref:oligosaccharide flippase family protein n=1 Tax=Halosimplex amylolyticum TaxID=3396616 RepID=UPI003F552883
MSDDGDVRGSSMLSILRGSSIFTVGTLVARAFGFLLTLALTHAVGAVAYGVYVFAKKLITVGAGLADLGADKAVLRFMPKFEDHPERQGAVLTLGLVTSLVASLAAAAVLAVAAPAINAYTLNEPLFPDALRVFAVVLPFYTLRRVVTATFRSLEQLEYTVGVNKVALPAAQVVAVGAAFLLDASLVGVVVALVLAGVVVFAGSFALLFARTDLRPRLAGTRDVAAEYYDYSLPLTISRAGSLVYSNVDVLMLGVLASGAADVGIYNVSLALASLLALPLMATNQVFPPVASRLYEADNYDDLESIYGFLTRWMFGVALLGGAALVVFRAPVLALFGPEFTAGSTVLVVLAVAKVVNVAAGPSGYVLMMTDHQYLNVVNQVSTALLNVVLNYVLILRYGMVGAAVATGISIAVVNVARIAQVWYFEGMTPYSRRYLKPVGAVGYATIAMLAVRLFGAPPLSGLPLILFGGLVGLGTFGAVVWLLGIDDADREFVDQTLSQVGD